MNHKIKVFVITKNTILSPDELDQIPFRVVIAKEKYVKDMVFELNNDDFDTEYYYKYIECEESEHVYFEEH